MSRRAIAPLLGLALGLQLSAPAFAQEPAVPPAAAPEKDQDLNRPLPDSAGLLGKALKVVPGGLTADRVASRTLASAATVRAQQAELEAAEARIRETTARFFPRLTLGASYTRLSPVEAALGSGALAGAANSGPLGVGPCPSGTGQCVLDSAGEQAFAQAFSIESLENQYSVFATLSVPISDYVLTLSRAIAASKANRSAARFSLAAEKLHVQAEARSIYYAWLRALGQVEAVETSMAQAKARLEDARAAYEVGTISKADLLRLEALVATTELLLQQAETARDLAVEQLRITMKDPPTTSYQVGEDVSQLPQAGNRESLAALVNQALQRRLELRALSERSRSFREVAGASRMARWPRLDAVAEATHANPNPRYFPPAEEWHTTWSAGVTLSFTVGDAFINDASAAQTNAGARAIDAQREALVDGIRREVTAAYLEHERAMTAIGVSGRQLAFLEEAYRVASDLYQVGRSTTTELIEAQAELFRARLSALDARIQERLSRARLQHAAGRDVVPER